MREQLEQYVKLLFAGTPDSEDMQQEILQNTLDRYDDLISQGKTPEAAYRLAISGIGDINEIVGEKPSPITVEVATKEKSVKENKKLMSAIAIAMYICSVIPLFVLGNIGDGILGLCIMFVIIAIATVLIILASNGSNEKTDAKSSSKAYNHAGYKAYKSISGGVTLAIYLGISFLTGAWHITWLIFLISGAVDGIVKAILDLKEAKHHEA